MTSNGQFVLRGLVVVASVLAVGLTLASAPGPVWLAALLLAALAAYASMRPGSHLVGLLVAGLAVNWLATVPVPSSTASWLAALGVAVLVLVVHASGALAASLPAQSPVPATSLRRWGRRVALVVVACVPVWAVGVTVSANGEPGRAVFTYAALAGASVLALGVWLASREPA